MYILYSRLFRMVVFTIRKVICIGLRWIPCHWMSRVRNDLQILLGYLKNVGLCPLHYWKLDVKSYPWMEPFTPSDACMESRRLPGQVVAWFLSWVLDSCCTGVQMFVGSFIQSLVLTVAGGARRLWSTCPPGAWSAPSSCSVTLTTLLKSLRYTFYNWNGNNNYLTGFW